MTEDEKNTLQANINRDSVEDKARDLSNWSMSFLKKDKHKVSELQSCISKYLYNFITNKLLISLFVEES